MAFEEHVFPPKSKLFFALESKALSGIDIYEKMKILILASRILVFSGNIWISVISDGFLSDF